MSVKVNFFLLITLAVLHCSLGAIREQNTNFILQSVSTLGNSGVEDDNSITHSITEHEPNEREKLRTYALDEYYKLALKTLQNGKEMLKDVVASLSALNGKNKKLSATVEEFSDLISKVEEIDVQNDSDDLADYDVVFDLFDKFSESLEALNITAMENPTAEDMLLDILLEKYGAAAVDDIYWTDFLTFMHKILLAAEEYWSTLTQEEQNENKKFKEWLMEHREAEYTDYNNKIKLYIKFFELYDD